MSDSPIRVLVLAPYASLRAGLGSLVREASDLELVGEVNTVQDLPETLERIEADVVLADIGEADPASVIMLLESERTALALLTREEGQAQRIWRANLPGAAALRQEAGREEIVAAVRAAGSGLFAIDPVYLPALRTVTPVREERREDPLSPVEALTPREAEVLQWMAQGLANKQIAAKLGVSSHTVKFHVASVLAKLNASSRTEAVTQGARRGLVLL